MTHNTDCIKCSCTEQNQVVKRTEFQEIQRSVCHCTSDSEVCGCGENTKEAVIEENDGVGHLFERAVEHSDRGAHETGQKDEGDPGHFSESFGPTDHFVELRVIDLAGLTGEQLVLVIFFAHGDDDHSDEAKDHAKNLDAINGLTVDKVAENARPEGTRLEEDDQQRERDHG